MTGEQRQLYRKLQKRGGEGESAGDAYALHGEGQDQLPKYLLQQLIWHTLPPPKARPPPVSWLDHPRACAGHADGCFGSQGWYRVLRPPRLVQGAVM